MLPPFAGISTANNAKTVLNRLIIFMVFWFTDLLSLNNTYSLQSITIAFALDQTM